MTLAGMLRVKNEIRWIERVIRSIRPICDPIVVFDDHSDDGTPELCGALGCHVVPSPFEGLDETRDKNYMMSEVRRLCRPDWFLCIDGDEELELRGQSEVLRNISCRSYDCYSLRVLYLWNSPECVRVDGVYGKFYRPSLFRNFGVHMFFKATGNGGNFHCSNVPVQHIGRSRPSGAALLHYGYMHREDRLRKYEWYNSNDPNNTAEDRYRHVVQGDLEDIPADLRLRHAGPLELRMICLPAA